MSPEKQRIAIAEACGWTDIRRQRLYLGNLDLWGTKLKGGEKHRNRLPDYLGDLNACHEMETWLKNDDRHAFSCYASDLFEEHGSDAVHLTAPQRCEAFLRTLGLWEEEAQ